MLGGCGDGEADRPPVSRLPHGDSSVSASTTEIVLEHQGRQLMTLPVSALLLGTVDSWQETASYDPYPIFAESAGNAVPAGLAWHAGRKLRVVEANDSRIELAVQHEGGLRSRLTLEPGPADTFNTLLVPDDSDAVVVFLGIGADVDAEEGLYGIGEVFDDVNHRGKLRAMQLELSDLESGYNEAHVPVPLVVGTRGWGMFVENPYPASFDLAQTTATRVQAVFGTADASSTGLRTHLLAAPHALDVTKRYYAVSGQPRLPGPWALGPWVWRDENDDQAQVEADLDTMRDLNLPTTAYWIDRPYATAVNTFDFAPAQFPDSDAMLAKMKSLGFRTALWHTPYLDEADAATEALRSEATTKGYYPPKNGLLFNKWGKPIDLTNPDAKAWWQSLIDKYVSRGVAGFKLDYAEDVVPNAFGATTGWEFSDGSTDRTMHSQFQRFYHETYAELLQDEDNFLICRGGTYGDQKNVSVVWPGDLDASFALHGELLKDDAGKSYKAVGGLPASIIAGLSLGPSGYPFYGADTGGYRHSPPDKEVFIRWFEQTALSSVMQIGTSSNDVAWEPTPKNGFDAEVLELYRRYTLLHLRLMPYLWTYAKRLSVDGRPLQRALGLAHPELGQHPNFDYLLGDHLLVAPVVKRGDRQRELTVPEGDYLSWWDTGLISGPGPATVDAPLDRLPLYLKAGGIVPLLRPSIETLSPTDDPQRVDSFATDVGLLYVRVAPGPESDFEVYDGTRLTQVTNAKTTDIGVDGGSVFSKGFVVELLLDAAPGTVEIDGKAAQKVDAGAVAGTESSFAFVNDPRPMVRVHLSAAAKTLRVTAS